MKPQRLASPPINEALIDLRAELAPGTAVERLAAFHAGVASTYPESEKRVTVSGSFEVGPSGQPKIDVPPPQHVGFMCWSSDRVQAVQARLDGFTLNRLRPYTHWEQFSGEAKACWPEYVRVASPTSVVRVALRYINRIEIPAKAEFSKYFRTLPQLAPELPQSVANLLMRVVLGVSTGRAVVLTMASETVNPAGNSGKIPVILDIDVFQEGDFKPDDPKIWDILEELRELKNRVFFDSLTEEALEVYR